MTASEHIGKPLACLLEPGESEPGEEGAKNQHDSPCGKVGHLTEHEHIAALFNDGGQRVDSYPELILFRKYGDRKKHG
ncbi:hypothetical protein D3C81_1747700 [compost metagenome]